MATVSALQAELKQTRPFRSAAEESLLALFRTAAVVRRDTAAPFESRELSAEQYNVLRILRGSEPAGLPTLEIAARLVDPTPAITRLADKLEAKRLIRRERSATDRRQVWCRITAPGLALLAELDSPVERSAVLAMARLSIAEQKLLIRLLAKLRAAAPGSKETTKS